ncbi:xylulokinase [Cribrihabitans marinus]|uniref:Xylulose kinase n=1 Tax=Cribrihabitans marinus TaxID=1227549 RepID=A0A1H7DSF4_9RHOB|nr:xylulokinase [Cribrihabitans marinus]GGH39810.1 xylulokinase [Cribrihabitans marinus]SEK04344.1 xylulokinase [Cribrihabitans marinus]
MFLGLDLGTSGVKALLVGEDQSVVGDASADLTVARPHAGWSEQDPADWLAATRQALAALSAEHDLSAVRGIGLSGQMHGATLLDASDRVLRPCILWNDTRAHAEAARLDSDPQFRALTGNIVFPGFTAPKLLWCREHEPEVFAQVAKVLLPKDYLRLWLTGEHVSEMSDAAGTSWLDTGRREWSDALLAATGLGRDHMPALVEGSEASGGLRPEVASDLGLPAGIPVAGGAGDNAASAVGAGVVRAGDGFVSLGTSGVLFAANDGYAPDPESALHTFCHALPGRWHQMGVILSATDALAWFGRLVGADPAALTGSLGALQPPGRSMFLPYLGGERTPHNDARIRATFLGLEHATDTAAATRAVLEGVAFAFRDSLEAMHATGTRIPRVIALGGGARSDYWLNVIATVLGLPVDIPRKGEFGAAFGAARLGMMAAEQGGAELATPPEIARQIAPDTALTDAFDDAYHRYRTAYGALKELS